ncbi:MAG: porin [Aquabacterium sp.]
MKIPRRTKLATALAIALISQAGVPLTARAETTFKVSGYGTLAGTVTDEGEREFRPSMNHAIGASHGMDFFGDSKLGLQGVANFGNGFSVTGQLLGQRRRVDDAPRSNEDFNVGFEWLFAQYSPTANIDIRAGRVVLPAFMISDSRNVGYSQPWLRAPLSVYAGMPLSNLDGGQLNLRIPMSSAILTLQPSYGRSSYNISSGTPTGVLVIKDRSKWVAGLNASLEMGDWLFRAGQVRSRTPDLSLDLLGPLTAPLSYNMKDTFTTAGLQFDNGSAVVMAEWTKRKMSDLPVNGGLSGGEEPFYQGSGYAGRPLAKTDAFYVGAGWRFGSVLPMLTYGRTRNLLTGVKNHELSASVRYDFMTNVALKAQVSRFNARDGQAFVTPAFSTPLGTDADYNKKINVFSVGLDFVF